MRIPSDTLIRFGFVLSLLILTGIGILSYHSLAEFIDTAQLVEYSHDVIEKLDELATEMSDVESAARGFAMAGEDFYLKPYDTALRKTNQTLGELRNLVPRNASQQRLAQKIEVLCSEKLAFSHQMVELRKQNGFSAASQLFLTGQGHQMMDRLRAAIDEMENAAKTALKERSAAAQLRGKNAIRALLIGTVLSFSMLSLVYYQLHREIIRRRSSEERAIHLNRLYAVLYEVGQGIVRMRQPGPLLREVCRIAVEQGLFQMAWVGLVNETQCIVPFAQFGADEDLTKHIRIALEDGSGESDPLGISLREGRHYVWSKGSPALPWTEDAVTHGMLSMAVVPIRPEGQLRGAFTVYSSDSDFFDEEIVGLLRSIADDISFALESIEQEEKRKRAEEEIRQLNKDLERRIEGRTTRLAELNKELAERNDELLRASRLKSEFLARMSHELRTPMNAIIGFSDLLAEESEGPLHEEYRRYVKHIEQGARHLLQLINDVLDLSKIEAGRLELFHSEFCACEALDEVISVIEPLARIKRIQLESRVARDLLVSADRTRFKQILYNLLSNAVKFTPEQGSVWIEARNTGGDVIFTVGDTGLGIAKEEHENIFDEFHQIGETTKGVKEGTGLGLAITRRLVEMHGGRISVDSQPGMGSRFTFDLKAAYGRMERTTASL
jgi:signal transduction histidine kinase/CHASE3 domain sensor protein